VLAYRAMVDVPRELVQYVARLLHAERRARGTRKKTRALTCFYQALLVLVWFRKQEDLTLLGAGFGISRATAYRYRDEGIAVLAAQAQDLHTALKRVAADGWSYVILDGKLFDCDRLTETTLSVRGTTIDAWFSGKHRDFGANIQAIMRPDGLPIWTSAAMPGHLHDTSCARELGVTAALNWSAAELDLPALADSGYERTGQGIKTPVKQPADGKPLAVDNRAYNRLLRGLRWQGERGFAILVGRWKVLRRTTISPRRIGDVVAAALHLTHFEYRYLTGSC
jgi:hypothetical protein